MEACQRRPGRASGRRRYFLGWTGQIAQFHRGGGDRIPLFPEKEPVTVAAPGIMFKFGMIKPVEVLLQSGIGVIGVIAVVRVNAICRAFRRILQRWKAAMRPGGTAFGRREKNRPASRSVSSIRGSLRGPKERCRTPRLPSSRRDGLGDDDASRRLGCAPPVAVFPAPLWGGNPLRR